MRGRTLISSCHQAEGTRAFEKIPGLSFSRYSGIRYLAQARLFYAAHRDFFLFLANLCTQLFDEAHIVLILLEHSVISYRLSLCFVSLGLASVAPTSRPI